MPNSYIYIYVYIYIYRYISNVVYRWLHYYLYSLHPAYTTYTCFIAYLCTTHCIACLYTICVYTPCTLLRVPIYSPDIPYILSILDIKHYLQLLKHCPCKTVVVVPPPRPPGGGGNHLAGGGWVVIPAAI